MYLTGTVFKVLKNMEKPIFSSSGHNMLHTLLPEARGCICFMQQEVKFTTGLTSDLTLRTQKQTHRVNTGTKRLKQTYKYILTSQRPLYYILNQKLADIKNLIYRDPHYLCFSKITHL